MTKKKNIRDSVSDFNKSRLVHAQIPLILTVALIPLILTHCLPLIPLISPFTHRIPLILLFKIPKSHGMLTNFLCLILCIFVVTEYVYIERMHIVMLYHAFLNS
jgi:hypothetical protein